MFIWNAGTAKATFAKDLSVGDLLVVSKSSNKSQVSIKLRYETMVESVIINEGRLVAVTIY